MNDPTGMTYRTPRRRVFNPLRLSDEEVEQTYIARRALLDSILGDLCAGNGSPPPQHHLVVGQRGMGKTMLLCRIAAELRKPEHREKFLPLSFPEEQYIELDRLSRFWLNCMDAVANALDAEGEHASAQELDARIRELDRAGAGPEEQAEETRRAFQAAINGLGRRPVLLLDNFHLLLKRLEKHDFALRAFFTRRGAPVLIGAVTVMPDQLQEYGAAFYDSFKTHVLHRLSVQEMHEVISQLAREAQRPDVADRLQAELPRLAVLRELTGGNPRTTVLLFELFAQGFSDDPYEDLECLLDQVTPLYQSRLDQLSEQAQLIFSTLARHWSPATAVQVTQKTQLRRSSVSPQLGRLEEIGLVEKTPIYPGKKTGYQIAERFFNIWYLMRFASRRQRSGLICLTRFLQEFYTPPELAERARFVLNKPELAAREATDALALADALLQDHLGRYEEAEQAYRRAIELDPKFASPWVGLGNLLMDYFGRYDEAQAAHQRAIELDPADDFPRLNLAFLFRDLLEEPDSARQMLSELKEEGLAKDTQALHAALFAAYDDNWGLARESLRSALEEIGDVLPVYTRDGWYRASAVLLHLGFGERLITLLQEEGADVRLMPWFEAVRAHVVGDERNLRNAPAEARTVAEEIYREIDRRRKQLPSATYTARGQV